MISRRPWTVAACVALAAGMMLAAGAVYPHAKAALAQVLLRRAWRVSAHGAKRVTPWPSADMAPVARIAFPRLGEHWIVLDNDSGQALAFGPGWDPQSARPGRHGMVVISAHRDTQFSALRHLRAGDRITLTSAGQKRSYAVRGARVIDSRTTRIDSAGGPDELLLVTCYPFDAITAGGPLRYALRATPTTPSPLTAQAAARQAPSLLTARGVVHQTPSPPTSRADAELAPSPPTVSSSGERAGVRGQATTLPHNIALAATL